MQLEGKVFPTKTVSMVSGFREQTVEKRGSSVFRVSESSEAECERGEPLERTSVFAGNARHRCSSILGRFYQVFEWLITSDGQVMHKDRTYAGVFLHVSDGNACLETI